MIAHAHGSEQFMTPGPEPVTKEKDWKIHFMSRWKFAYSHLQADNHHKIHPMWASLGLLDNSTARSEHPAKKDIEYIIKYIFIKFYLIRSSSRPWHNSFDEINKQWAQFSIIMIPYEN